MKDRIRTVLRVRELAERRAVAHVAGAERDLEAAQRRLDERRRAYGARQPLCAPVGIVQLRALELQGLACHDLVQDAVADRDLSADRRTELVRAWSMASIQRKSVERLAELRGAEQAAAARAAADRALDEAVLLRRPA